MADCILVLDEGTTSTRAIVFDRSFVPVAMAQNSIELTFPNNGWVEQDGETIWQETLAVARAAIAEAGGIDRIAALAITNQRETTLVWDRATSTPCAPAIVWQDRRTASACERLRAEGHGARVQDVTGLVIDPYFSSTKLDWLIRTGAVNEDRARSGELAFGTVETWLIWNLTGGTSHVTDVTNASRTLLMDLQSGTWSEEMCALFGVPEALLPEIRPSASLLGETRRDLFGKSIPILAAIGDQQGALVGQGCLSPGLAKITLGTGAFLVANTGAHPARSTHRLLATSAYAIEGTPAAFALEGAIFNAGTVVQWLRDELGLIAQSADSEMLARETGDNGGVYFVPAFTGLGAPHWAAEARGEISGITRATRAGHIVRAGLEATAYQTLDLIEVFRADGAAIETLKVDGGMAQNAWLMQFMADICDTPIERPDYPEMTALGAAALAGIQLGWTRPEDWQARHAPGQRFEPAMAPARRSGLVEGWRRAVGKATQPS